MSVHITSAVWNLDLPCGLKIVLLKLGDNADDSGSNAWPSVDTIATQCGISRATVQRTLRKLQALGYISIEAPSNRHRPTTYRVETRGLNLRPLKRGASPAARRGLTGARRGLTRDDEGPHSEARSIIEPSLDPSRIRQYAPATLPERLYLNIWPGSKPRPIVVEELVRISTEHTGDCIGWVFGEVGITDKPSMFKIRALFRECDKIGHGPRERWYESDRGKGRHNGTNRRDPRDNGKYRAEDGWQG